MIIAIIIFAPIAVLLFWLLAAKSLESGVKNVSSSVKEIKKVTSHGNHVKFAKAFWAANPVSSTNQMALLGAYRREYFNEFGKAVELKDIVILDKDMPIFEKL